MTKSQRRMRLAEDITKFIRQYSRKADRNHDPNDRHYDRKVEKQIKQMKTEELDELLRDIED